jgi:hypothetical protein
LDGSAQELLAKLKGDGKILELLKNRILRFEPKVGWSSVDFPPCSAKADGTGGFTITGNRLTIT